MSLVGSTPAAAARDLRYHSSWALDLYGAPKSLFSHIPVFTGAGSMPAVNRAVSSAVYGRRKPALENSAVNTTSRLTTSIEVSPAAKRRTICSRWAVAVLGNDSMRTWYAPPEASAHC